MQMASVQFNSKFTVSNKKSSNHDNVMIILVAFFSAPGYIGATSDLFTSAGYKVNKLTKYKI